MSANEVKITSDQFREFVVYCDYWITALNLRNWRITIVQSSDIQDNGYADVTMDFNGRIAGIALNTKSNKILTSEEDLNRIACHECLHIFLRRLEQVWNNRLYEYYTEASHEVIRVLEDRLISFYKTGQHASNLKEDN